MKNGDKVVCPDFGSGKVDCGDCSCMGVHPFRDKECEGYPCYNVSGPGHPKLECVKATPERVASLKLRGLV